LLKQYGQELIDDPRRTEALLRDHCGQHTREIFVLVNAQKQRVPSELLSAPAWMPRQATYSRLSKTLQTKLALTEDAANWAVAAWAAALDLESLPKGDVWSWLPGQSRPPAPTSSRKSRSKKRQNSPSSVQSTKSSTRNSSRQAKDRAARAEMGWGFPKLDLTSILARLKTPATWANLLPWMALLTATVFLLAVVYWTSTTRGDLGDVTEIPSQVNADGTPIVENNTEGESSGPNATATINSNVTPLPELPAPARDYLSMVISLPTWANVNADDPLLVRQGPSTNQPFITTVQDGDPVSVVAFSEDGKWSQIASPHAGWVNNDFLLFSRDDPTQPKLRLNVQLRHAQSYEVNIYSAPFATADVIETLSPNEIVIVAASIGEPAAWYQVADPAIGWVAASDVTPVTP
jgi:hypothetical protein